MNLESNEKKLDKKLDNLDKRQKTSADEEAQITSDRTKQSGPGDGRYLLGVRGGYVVEEDAQVDGGLGELGRHGRGELAQDVGMRAHVALVVLGRVARARSRHFDALRVALEWTVLRCALDRERRVLVAKVLDAGVRYAVEQRHCLAYVYA